MGTLRELHPNPRFTKYLVEKRVFENDPLVVVDVGARKGFEKHWNHYGDQINLIGFEPNKESYKECVEEKSNTQTTYYPYALDISAGERDLYVTANISGCSLLKPNKNTIEKFGMEDHLTIMSIDKVQTIDLDTFTEQNNIENIDFIKLDTEGTELNILKGSKNILKKSVLGLSIEVKFIKVNDDQPLFFEIDKYLRSLGFELYDLDINRSTRKTLAPYASVNLDIGQVLLAQALYLRDTATQLEVSRSHLRFWNKSKILKMTSIQELFNLPDCSIELIQKYESLGIFNNIQAKEWSNLLVPQLEGEEVSYEDYLNNIRVAMPSVDYRKKGKYTGSLNIGPRFLGIIKKILKIFNGSIKPFV